MLYKLSSGESKDEYKKVKRVTLDSIGWVELDLEKLISKNINDFIATSDLMTIFNERKMQEEPDILALDENGELYIFELKRWASQQENLLQVLRYGQLFGSSCYDDLESMYKKYKGNADANLSEDLRRHFDKDEMPLCFTEEINPNQHFVIVTNGVDQATLESIIYWQKCGLNIDAIVYWVFEIGDEHYIEFNTYSQVEHYLEYESNCYILNTNKQQKLDDEQKMLEEKKAAAFCGGWKEKITRLQKGDLVFLYSSGKGIIAYGWADGKLNKVERAGIPEDEYNMHLNNFKVLSRPIPASEMKEVANQGFNFRQTMYAISEEAADKILDLAKTL